MAMYQMIAQWVAINEATKELYMPLIDATYVLMNEVCMLMRFDMDYLLDVWKQEEFVPEKAAERIIAEKFEIVDNGDSIGLKE